MVERNGNHGSGDAYCNGTDHERAEVWIASDASKCQA
jgi:hypothetical protein